MEQSSRTGQAKRVPQHASDALRTKLARLLEPRAFQVALVAVLAAVTLFLREPDVLLRPQFWAEDGLIFFLEQYTKGRAAIWEPYAGYLHLTPRLIALFTDKLVPYSAIPAAYNYTSLLLTVLVVTSVLSRRLELPYRPLLALSVVLVPHPTNEVFLTITNLQWIMPVLVLVTLLKTPPHPACGNEKLQALSDLAIVVICGLTGPFIIFTLPFFAAKALRRDAHARPLLLAATVTAAVQASVILEAHSAPGDGAADPDAYAAVLGQKFFGNLFLGTELPYLLHPYALCASLALVLGFIVYGSFTALRGSVLTPTLLLVFGLCLVLAALHKATSPLDLLAPAIAPRYFYLPYVAIAWLLILILGHSRGWLRAVAALLLAASLVSSLSDFQSEPLADRNWSRYAARIGKEDLLVPLNPEGWGMRVPSRAQLGAVPPPK